MGAPEWALETAKAWAQERLRFRSGPPRWTYYRLRALELWIPLQHRSVTCHGLFTARGATSGCLSPSKGGNICRLGPLDPVALSNRYRCPRDIKRRRMPCDIPVIAGSAMRLPRHLAHVNGVRGVRGVPSMPNDGADSMFGYAARSSPPNGCIEHLIPAAFEPPLNYGGRTLERFAGVGKIAASCEFVAGDPALHRNKVEGWAGTRPSHFWGR